MNKIFLILLCSILLLSIASAETSLGIFKKGNSINIEQSRANCTQVNLTKIIYPNSTYALNQNVEMTKSGNDYNYTFSSTSELGTYTVKGQGLCDGVEDVFVFTFEITSTGKSFFEEDSLGAIAILFGALVTSFLFIFIGFRLAERDELIVLSFFFVIVGIILIVYSLFLGWTIGSDIIEHEAFSETSEVIFVSIMWLLIGLAVISFILFLIAFIKEFGNAKKLSNFGEGFNPITNTYDY